LSRLAGTPPQWALGCEAETWWSRLAPPALPTWRPEQHPVRLPEKRRPKTDSGPKALACSGLLVRDLTAPGCSTERVWLRVALGRPVSAVTSEFLAWVCPKLAALGKRAVLVVWDNASWHRSQAVRRWLRDHNRRVNHAGAGIRIVSCQLPIQSPWLKPLDPHWGHGNRAVVEPDRLLSAAELSERGYAYCGCSQEEPVPIPQKVA
jgi:hypothetical protein